MKKKMAFSIILVSLILCLMFCYFGGKALIKKIGADIHHDRISMIFDGVVDFQNNQLKEGYRFYWDFSLGSAVLITVYIEGEQPKLNYKIAVHPNTEEYKPRELFDEKEILLTKEQLKKLRATVNDNQFWKENISKDFGLDGADWTIEVKQQNVYHRDFQWSPRNGSIRNIGLCLLELSPYDVESNELYIIAE